MRNEKKIGIGILLWRNRGYNLYHISWTKIWQVMDKKLKNKYAKETEIAGS